MDKIYQALNCITGWLLLLIVFNLSVTSCSDETSVGTGNSIHEEDDQISVRFTINTSDLQKPGTRSLEEEELIEEVAVLVLSKPTGNTEFQFLYSVNGTNISHPNSSTTTFSAVLRASNDSIRLILIANANQIVEEKLPEINDTETQVKNKLVYQLDDGDGEPKQITGNLPMSGVYSLPNLDLSDINDNIQIRMLRSIAKADVYNNDATGHFSLQSVQVFRPYNNIQLIPGSTSTNSTGGPKVDTPSLPAEATFYPVSSPMPPQEIVSGGTSIEEIYLPEAPAPATERQISDATCLIVGGIYNDGISPAQTVYYRIDFNPSGYPLGEILRNHRYMFIIQGVSAAGWDTPEAAATNASSGMATTVEAWDEHTSDMYFDGEHHYGVSARYVNLGYRINSQEIIDINTDLSGGELLQWVNADGTPLNSDAPSASLSSTRFDVSVQTITDSNNQPRRQFLFHAKQANNTTSDYSEYMMIHINRWKIMITITQSVNKNSNKYVYVLSSNDVGGMSHSSTAAMQAILSNQFGPGKTVQLAGIGYSSVSAGTSISTELTSTKLAQHDILVLANNTRPDLATAQRVLDWLNASNNRVLVLCFDWKDSGVIDSSNGGFPENSTTTNYQVLRLLRSDVTPYWYNGGSNTSIGDTGPTRSNMMAPFNINADNSYFFQTGPFTASGSPITSASFWLDDIYWGRINIISPDITPLVVFNNVIKDDGTGQIPTYTPNPGGDGRMIVGIDKKKRIVYIGDSEAFTAKTDGNATQRSGRIDNTSGNLTNSYARIMANLWAWMIEEVVFSE